MASHSRGCTEATPLSAVVEGRDLRSRRSHTNLRGSSMTSISEASRSCLCTSSRNDAGERTFRARSVTEPTNLRPHSLRRGTSVTIYEDSCVRRAAIIRRLERMRPERKLSSAASEPVYTNGARSSVLTCTRHGDSKEHPPVRPKSASCSVRQSQRCSSVTGTCASARSDAEKYTRKGRLSTPPFQAGLPRAEQAKPERNSFSFAPGRAERSRCRVRERCEQWFTGGEHLNAALISLFVACGASEQGGLGLTLFMKDFSQTCETHQPVLPPKRIVLNAISSMKSVCIIQPSTDKPGGINFCLALPDFFALLTKELRGFTSAKVQGSFPPTREPPAVCIVLAALVPEALERVFNAEVVEHFRNPLTIAYALEKLESQYENQVSTVSDAVRDKASITISSLPQERVQHRRDVGRSACVSGSPSPVGGERSYPSISEITFSGDKSLAEAPYTGTNSTLSEVGRKAQPVPRYMKPRLLDEISTSIIARAKARKLMDRLRKSAIPINRHVCFARIFYSQQAKAGVVSANDDCCLAFTDSDDSDSEALVQLQPDPPQGRLRPTNILKWPLYDEYARGFSGINKHRKPRRGLFEEQQGQFAHLKVCSDPPISQPCSVAMSSSRTFEIPESLSCFSLSTSLSTSSELTANDSSPLVATMTTYQRRMSKLLDRCSSQSEFSLADLSAVRFGMYGATRRRLYSASTGGTAAGVNDKKTTRGKSRTRKK
ncbi:hypothetical protein, conserved [Trypanosoma brucei gambiense DAL972]|uniref:Uncharacterized protein n=1 Tax=Trypanosoma brucei gambiense (strain MHOM/CI/86/DAL972) TaxID=679716 RepID=D0A196_TRYB9|nr:hypothetical protein, conserved [Trypanosoma brucei gambiense DAL972]CBH15038.1 hypothetical protein, conserved [Trypanosoma brucei gambiense DAL972]|eukprot:XP_011777304.1 hypothetical protein, conserved [Trypanosoma brucei gambiense DAL972]